MPGKKPGWLEVSQRPNWFAGRLVQVSVKSLSSTSGLPKAVVVDPRGQAYVVQRDTRIGNKGGIIDSITQYMVVVKEPNAEEPVKMTIKPPYVDLAGQAGFSPGDFEMSESDFDAPPAVNPSRGSTL